MRRHSGGDLPPGRDPRRRRARPHAAARRSHRRSPARRSSRARIVDGARAARADEVVARPAAGRRSDLKVGDHDQLRRRPGRAVEARSAMTASSAASVGGATHRPGDAARGSGGSPASEVDQISTSRPSGVSRDELRDRIAALPLGPGETGAGNADRSSADIGEHPRLPPVLLLVFGGIASSSARSSSSTPSRSPSPSATRSSACCARSARRAASSSRTVLVEALADRADRLGARARRRLRLVARPARPLFEAIGIRPAGHRPRARAAHIIVALVVGIVVTLVSSLVPALRSTRVPPIAAPREGLAPAPTGVACPERSSRSLLGARRPGRC